MPAEPPSATDAPLDLLDSARLLGGHVWVERRLHEVLGAWSADASRPEVAVLLDSQALHHAWYASVFVDRLPQLRELPVDRVVAAPPGAAERLERLAATAGDRGRLTALVQDELPGLVDTYEGLLRRLTRVADAPLQRWLRIVLGDLERDLGDAAALLADLPVDEG
jgi:hypothetical protein